MSMLGNLPPWVGVTGDLVACLVAVFAITAETWRHLTTSGKAFDLRVLLCVGLLFLYARKYYPVLRVVWCGGAGSRRRKGKTGSKKAE
jgi:hypothetical protein